jgi:hypothetical protein
MEIHKGVAEETGAVPDVFSCALCKQNNARGGRVFPVRSSERATLKWIQMAGQSEFCELKTHTYGSI